MTWHRMTRRDFYAAGINSHDEADCPNPDECKGEVVTSESNRFDMRAGWMEREGALRAMTNDARADAIRVKVAALRTLEADIRALVDDARMAGIPWSGIGDALGVTKQAAQKRYSA